MAVDSDQLPVTGPSVKGRTCSWELFHAARLEAMFRYVLSRLEKFPRPGSGNPQVQIPVRAIMANEKERNVHRFILRMGSPWEICRMAE